MLKLIMGTKRFWLCMALGAASLGLTPMARAQSLPSVETAFARLQPSVVLVRAEIDRPPPDYPNDLQRLLAPQTPQSRRNPDQSSGFVVDAANGIIATTDYAAPEGARLEVELGLGERRAAALVGRDEQSGLAVLRVAPGGLTAVHWAASSRTGQEVVAVGYAFGLGPMVSDGVVAGQNLPLDQLSNDVMYLDLAVQKGMAGAPVANLSGEVVAMSYGQYGVSRLAHENYGVAIPSADVRRVVETIMQHGHVPRAELGLALSDEGQTRHAYAVLVGGPAERAGLRAGDEVLSVNGAGVESDRAFQQVVASVPVGSTFIIRIRREGREMDLVMQSIDRAADQ